MSNFASEMFYFTTGFRCYFCTTLYFFLDRSNIQSRFDFVDDGETTDTDRSETTIKELHIDSSDDDSQSTQVQMKL